MDPPAPALDAANPAQSPAIRAIQREEPPPISATGVARGPGSLASVRSGRDLIKAADEPTIFVPSQLYAFLTSPEHTVTACLANSAIDMPVRIIAEHLFGLDYGSFGLWTGEHSAQRPPLAKEPTFKGVKGWLGRLTLGKRSESPMRKSGGKDKDTGKDKDSERDDTDKSSRAVSDESDGEDEHWRAMRPLSLSELKEVRRCGQWHGAQPSDLFLHVSFGL